VLSQKSAAFHCNKRGGNTTLDILVFILKFEKEYGIKKTKNYTNSNGT
jgi:hypothetical protein